MIILKQKNLENEFFFSKGTFVWQESHQVASYTNWWPGEPDVTTEDCVLKAQKTIDGSIYFGWNDKICTTDHNDYGDPWGQIPGGIYALCMRN